MTLSLCLLRHIYYWNRQNNEWCACSFEWIYSCLWVVKGREQSLEWEGDLRANFIVGGGYSYQSALHNNEAWCWADYALGVDNVLFLVDRFVIHVWGEKEDDEIKKSDTDCMDAG